MPNSNVFASSERNVKRGHPSSGSPARLKSAIAQVMRFLCFVAVCLCLHFFVQAQTSAPPVVQMLLPGLIVEELPIKLGNQNNLRFAPDGTLTSLGYDGKIWRLRDTNGDG